MDDVSKLEWSPEELREAFKNEDTFTLMDVRTDEERSYARLDDDRWVPMAELPSSLEELNEVPKPIVVYCHHGIRSLQAVQFFRQNGLDETYSLAGGIDAWSRNVDDSVPTY